MMILSIHGKISTRLAGISMNLLLNNSMRVRLHCRVGFSNLEFQAHINLNACMNERTVCKW